MSVSLSVCTETFTVLVSTIITVVVWEWCIPSQESHNQIFDTPSTPSAVVDEWRCGATSFVKDTTGLVPGCHKDYLPSNLKPKSTSLLFELLVCTLLAIAGVLKYFLFEHTTQLNYLRHLLLSQLVSRIQ